MVEKTTQAQAEKRPRHRSPNYPSIHLGAAIVVARKLYDVDKTHKVPIATVHARMGYKAHSSSAMQTEAALKAFGLLDVEGEGKNRKVGVSEMGERIVRSAPNHQELIRKASLRPKMHRELWGKYAAQGLPSDEVIKNYLVWDRSDGQFKDEAATELIRNFRATIALAKLAPGDKIEESNGGDGGGGDDEHQDLPLYHQKPRIKQGGSMPDKAREEVFVVPEGGEIILQFPAQLSKATFDDLQDWLKITIRKIGRLVRDEELSEGSESADQ